MNTQLEFSFLEEGFSAKDIVEQKIKESSLTVNGPGVEWFRAMLLCWRTGAERVSLFDLTAGRQRCLLCL